MFQSIGLPEIAVLLVVGLLLFIPAILYVRTLKQAMEQCSLHSLTMSPGTVWFLLIPLFGEFFQFYIVINIAKSLQREFARRGIPSTSPPGRSVGLAMCILTVLNFIPLIGTVAGIGACVCWCVYWRKIAGFTRMLEAAIPDPRASAGPW